MTGEPLKPCPVPGCGGEMWLECDGDSSQWCHYAVCISCLVQGPSVLGSRNASTAVTEARAIALSNAIPRAADAEELLAALTYYAEELPPYETDSGHRARAALDNYRKRN